MTGKLGLFRPKLLEFINIQNQEKNFYWFLPR